MQTQKYAIFDLEIIKAIPPKDEADRIPEIEYCAGWRDFENMGISCISFCEIVLQGDETIRNEAYCLEWKNEPGDIYENIRDHVSFISNHLRSEGYLIGGFNSKTR